MEEPEKGFVVSRYGDSIIPLTAVSATSISGGDLVYVLVPYRESEAPAFPSSKRFLQLLRSSRSPALLAQCEGQLQDGVYATLSYHLSPPPFHCISSWDSRRGF